MYLYLMLLVLLLCSLDQAKQTFDLNLMILERAKQVPPSQGGGRS